MSNINSKKEGLIDFLRQETGNTQFVEQYSALNEKFLDFFISNLFEKREGNLEGSSERITHEQMVQKKKDEDFVKLISLRIEKQPIDKQIANLQNILYELKEKGKISKLKKEEIISNYFNTIKNVLEEILEKNNDNKEKKNQIKEIIKEIECAKTNLNFENCFKKEKEKGIPKEVFFEADLNLKTDNKGIIGFNTMIFDKIESFLDQKEFDEQYQKRLLRNFSNFRFKTLEYRNQLEQEKNTENNSLSLEDLEKESLRIANEINLIQNELSPEFHIEKDKAVKILQKIFSKIQIIQNKYNLLNDKESFKTSYRDYHYNNQVFENIYINFRNRLAEKFKFNVKKFSFKDFKGIEKKEEKDEFLINFMAFSFLSPIILIEEKNISVIISNNHFREQLILILKKIACFYKISDYENFQINLDFVSNDQIKSIFLANKLDLPFSISRIIPEDDLKNDKRFREIEANSRHWEEYKFLDIKIDNEKFNVLSGFEYLDFIIQYIIEKLKEKELIQEFFNLDNEKLKVLSGFKYLAFIIEKLKEKELIQEFFNLDNEKLKVLSGFKYLASLIETLKEKELVQEFFNLDNEKLKVLSGFEYLVPLIETLKEKELIQELFNLDNEKLKVLSGFKALFYIIKTLKEKELIQEFFNLDNEKLKVLSGSKYLDSIIETLKEKELVQEFFNLDNEKFNVLSGFEYLVPLIETLKEKELIQELFNLDNEKLKVLSGFKDLDSIIETLKEKELIQEFFNLDTSILEDFSGIQLNKYSDFKQINNFVEKIISETKNNQKLIPSTNLTDHSSFEEKMDIQHSL